MIADNYIFLFLLKNLSLNFKKNKIQSDETLQDE